MSKSPAPAMASPVPSNAAVFVTNLRLLDLDHRKDWPSITAQTLSTKDVQQNQKTRIRCVEWALYRLFEIWDPEETQNVRSSYPYRSNQSNACVVRNSSHSSRLWSPYSRSTSAPHCIGHWTLSRRMGFWAGRSLYGSLCWTNAKGKS